MVCKECGKRMKSKETVCPHCGAAVVQSVSLGAASGQADKERAKKPKKKLSGTDLALRISLIVVSVLAVLGILFGILYIYARSLVKENAHIDEKFTEEEKKEMHVNTDLPTAAEGIQSIALFGLDERGETDALVTSNGKGKSFHSDAIIILTIDRRDKNNPRVKLSSIARDTLVYVEGYNSKGSKTKLTHAFDYGYRKAKSADKADGKQDYTEADYKREGAKVAIKTINYNFQMNVTEYMYVNFVEFMDIIDYVGGVTINVQQRELNELNKHVRAMEKECGRDLNLVKKAGEQTLDGGQALAYSRIRKIDSDLKRANRQRDVLKALFDKVKQTPVNKLPDVISKMLSLCHTTLTADEILELGTWAVTNNPEIINYTLPDTGTKYGYDWIWEGTHETYGWVWIYDLDYASALLIDFIFDKYTAQDLPRPTMPNEPKKTNATTVTTATTSSATGTDPTGSTTSTDYNDPTDTDYTDPTGTDTDYTDPTGTDTDYTDPTGGDSDPTTPVDPTDPVDPTEPTNPVEPTEPSESVTSTTPGFGVVETTTTAAPFDTP